MTVIIMLYVVIKLYVVVMSSFALSHKSLLLLLLFSWTTHCVCGCSDECPRCVQTVYNK